MKGDINERYKWTRANASMLDTSDWEAAVVGGFGAGRGLGGIGMYFSFRSPALDQYLKFAFVGLGPALGTVGGAGIPPGQHYNCSQVDWKALGPSIPEPFSASNLVNATGRLSVIALATEGKAGWGYTELIMTARYRDPQRSGYLFDKFTFRGTSWGTGGLGLGVHWGKWVFLGLPSSTEINTNWTKPVCRT